MTHRIGPWNVCEPTNWPEDYDLPAHRLRQSWSVGVRPGGVIAFVDGRSPDETAANARLIAAAPDMLAALELVVTEGHNPDCAVFDRAALGELCTCAVGPAEEAIAKAKDGMP